MAKYLLDTNACIGIRNSFRGVQSKDSARRAAQAKLIARWKAMPAADLAMSFITLGELRVWVEKHASRTAALALLQQVTHAVQVIGSPTGAPGTDNMAEHYANIRATLESTGKGIDDNDLWIAAHARALGLIVVTHNLSHFGRVPALATEDWTV